MMIMAASKIDSVTYTTKALVPRQSISSSINDPANSPSLSQLVSTLIPTLMLAGFYMTFFLILRPRLPRCYAPRTYLQSLRPQERSEPLPKGLLNWIVAFFKISDDVVLNRHSLDGFLLLRYMKISVAVCFVGVLITWPVLMPVSATGGGGEIQLNLISFSNIANSSYRYYAHALIAWIYFGFIFYMIMRENIYYVNLRQAYLISPLYADRISSKTVLFTSVPEDYRSESVLRKVLGNEVQNIWIVCDCAEIENLVKRRDKIAMKLEAAETKLIQRAKKAHLKNGTCKSKEQEVPREHYGALDDESGSIAARWIPPSARPTHRLKIIFGKKVDTINWCRAELDQIIPKVKAMQEKFRTSSGKSTCSVFAEYNSQNEAQAAYQSLIHHQPLHMAPRYIGVNPEEVIWDNLNISWASSLIRNIVITGVIIILILFWAIPVAFIGTLSNISALTRGDPTANPPQKPLLPWLDFINNIPPFILGVIQGLLPSTLLALLMMLLPPFLRWTARLSGKPSLASVELRVQNIYFLFQVIQVFLVTTISSGAASSAAAIINNPTSATSLLAQDLPKASNFYVSYFILQGLAIASAGLANPFDISVFMTFGWLFDSTPRKKYKRFVELDGLHWGSEFPVYTLLTVIAITYSIIAPLVLGFATVGIYLIYLSYRYNLLFVFDANIDTKGLVYARALQQTTTGCYLGIFCLIGLFAVKAAVGPLILMIALLVFLILWQMSLNSAIGPLLSFLPKSLQVEEESLLRFEAGENTTDFAHDDKQADCENVTGPIHNDKESHREDLDHTNSMSSPLGKSNSILRRSSFKRRPTFSQKPTPLTRFFFPHKHCDWHYFRKMVPQNYMDSEHGSAVEHDAYHHPAVTSETPMLWIPRDPMGVSAQECKHTSHIIPMTDEGAGFDLKGHIVWDHDERMPPIHEEKIFR